MELINPLRLMPTMPMLAEFLRQCAWNCEAVITDESQIYRGIRLYHHQTLQKDVVYLLRPEETDFPFDSYSYLSAVSHGGKANHLVVPQRQDAEIMDQLLEVFSQFQSWENAIDLLVYRNANLQELCELGAELLENPVCIHDDWFVMMGITSEFAEIMEPEYLMSSSKGFVPRAVVEDFQDDSDYLETYSQHGARLWSPQDQAYQSMYVNLWDGVVYKGRLLVARKNRNFLCRDFLVAEVLTQRAMMLLRRKQLGGESRHQNMDDIVFGLLLGQQPDPAGQTHLLNMLRWNPAERFLCLRIRPQQVSATVVNHMLHSDLFRLFPGSYILLDGQEQCVLLNLSQNILSQAQVHHLLAPLCRDYGLYAGISSPVAGIAELEAAYVQAGMALEQTFKLRGHKWIMTFSECVMEYIMEILPNPLKPEHLVAPELRELIRYDREKGTQYFDTLRTFLLQERDIPKTAETLIIHRTTLLYRLKKMQTLIHLDLDDPWRRLQLMLSLWILEAKGSR